MAVLGAYLLWQAFTGISVRLRGSKRSLPKWLGATYLTVLGFVSILADLVLALGPLNH